MNPSKLPLPYRSLARLAWLVTFCIAYAQLVPFEYRAVPFAQAIAQVTHLEWRDLYIEDRVDWTSNLVMNLPFGFLMCGALSRNSLAGAAILTALLGTALAAGTEFVQIWDSPRVSSLNDVIPQVVGTIVGLSIWTFSGRRLVLTVRVVFARGPQALRAALFFYLFAYCFVALFPFDFRFSAAEIHTRLSDPDAIVLIPQHLQNSRGLIYLLLKGVLMAPVGAMLTLIWRRGVMTAILAALALSFTLEVAHWFEYSETADVASVVVAILGAMLGSRLANSFDVTELFRSKWLRQGAWVIWPFYGVGLAALRGWRLSLVSREQIQETLATLHWLPFYYGYFVTEPRALASTVDIAASFAPVGVLIWATRFRPDQLSGKTQSLEPSLLTAVLLSVVIEIGGLITAGHRPDPTNVLIAAVVAVIAQRSCEWLARVLSEVSTFAKSTP